MKITTAKDELFDEEKLARQIAQGLADEGLAVKLSLSLGHAFASMMIQNLRLTDLVSWLTVHTVTTLAKEQLRTPEEVFKAIPLLNGMCVTSKEHMLEAFSSLEGAPKIASLLKLVAERKWDEALAHVHAQNHDIKISKD